MGENGIFSRLDAEQRAAVALRANGTVSAGAGSGKTTVLAARYLDLVISSGADVRSILCLTFTRKAAAEMRERVYRELSASDSPRSRAAVERFAEASISTIDSFCGSILRSSAQEYGYAPDFAVDDEAAKQLARDEALRFLLERREEPSLARLFALMGFESCWRELFAEAAYRFASPALRPEGDFAAMPARAAAFLEREGRAAVAAAAEAVAAGLSALDEGGEPHTAKGKEAAALFRSLSALSPKAKPEETTEAAAALARLDLRAFGKSPVEAALKAAATAGREAARLLQGLARARDSAPLEAAILGLLAEFAGRYRAAKRAAGVMGFRDVAVAAVDLLARRPELRAYWKRRYRYIMVDEFQDDDELQKELLYLLAEGEGESLPGLPAPALLAPDKLFFVGDDKQSIYRFRGADVSVFNRLGRELSRAPQGDAAALGGDGASPRLSMNYRSEPGLVAFFNEVFSRVFPSREARERGGEIPDYEACFGAAGSRAPTAGLEPSVSLFWKPRNAAPRPGEEEPMSEDEALAASLARFIKKSVEEGSLGVPEKGGLRKAGYGDFAVLLRSTSKQYLIERFFRLYRIPYSAASVRGLFVESPANDIYSGLRLALLPEDRLAYAAVLRSPLVALSDDGFVRVLASGLPSFDEAAKELLSEDDRARFGHGQALFAGLGRLIDRKSAAEAVGYLWQQGGLRLSILRKPEAHPYLEHYDYLYALAVESDRRGEGLSSLLSRLEPLMGRPEKLDDIDVQREAGSGVRIMSVHKSKGLEFPVVILPWIGSGEQKEGPGEAFYCSAEAGLTLNLRPFDEPDSTRENIFYQRARELEAAKAAAETKRLFYVACTRAEAHLVFAACEPWRADSSSFLALLAGGGGKRGEDGLFEALPESVRLVEVPELPGAEYRRLFGASRPRRPDAFAPAYRAASPLERSYPRRSIPATTIAEAVWARDPRSGEPGEELPGLACEAELEEMGESRFGEICHALIALAIEAGRSGGGLGGEVLAGLRSRLPESLLSGLEGAARERVLAEASRLASRFLASPLGARVLGAPRCETEKNLILAGEAGARAILCRLDLFAEGEESIDIVDFKSDRWRRAGRYDAQLALYRSAAQGLEPGKKARSCLFWLRDGLAEPVDAEISPESLDAAVASILAAGEKGSILEKA
jgi:ATP-dependent helicase/nuclease subunit A